MKKEFKATILNQNHSIFGIGFVDLFFSYNKLIAIKLLDRIFIINENLSKTTKKYLNKFFLGPDYQFFYRIVKLEKKDFDEIAKEIEECFINKSLNFFVK